MVIHLGDLGTGAAAKLMANAALLGVLGTLGEALALAQALGVSRDTAYQVLAATSPPRKQNGGAPRSKPASSRPASRSP